MAANVNSVITADLSSSLELTTPYVYQYDHGLKLRLLGISYTEDNPPQFQFSNGRASDSVTLLPQFEDGE